MTKIALDAIDRRMLAELQADARLTTVELADRVGLSASPCTRRLKRLEEDGVIAGYRATLDRAKLGLGLTLYVGIKTERHQEADAKAFEVAVNALDEVISCHLMSGDIDFLLQIVVPDLQAYERLLYNALLKLPGVKDIRSSFAIRTVKTEGPLPLDHLPAR